MLAGWFARRYFFSKKSHSVINLIAGVSVVAGYEVLFRINSHVARTNSSGVVVGFGCF